MLSLYGLLVALVLASGLLLATAEAGETGPAPDECAALRAWAQDGFFSESAATGGVNAEPGLAKRLPFSFVYGGKPSSGLLSAWKRQEKKTPAAAGRELRVITYTDPVTGLEVRAEATLLEGYPAIDWVLHFTNTGKSDSPVLESVLPLDLGIGVPDGGVILHRAQGSTAGASDYLPVDEKLALNAAVNLAPNGGCSSDGVLPFFNMEWQGGGLAWAIGWSGQWSLQVRREASGRVEIKAGQQIFRAKLHPGESIRTPRILLVSWAGASRMRGHNLLRQTILARYSPRLDGEVVLPPVSQNTWFLHNTGNDTTEENQLKRIQAMPDLGVEVFWLDAGWYEGGWPNGAGNWFPNAGHYPRGLRPLADEAHRRGLKFLLWFAPEMVSPASRIAKEHPEFVLAWKDFQKGDGIFNLGDPAARAWMTNHLSKCIQEWSVDIYRTDFGGQPLLYWQKNDEADRQGITENRCITGLYAMWDELRRRHPRLIFDDCASGGRRIDLEMISRSYVLFRSDSPTTKASSAAWDQAQTAGLSLYVPVHATGSTCGIPRWSSQALNLYTLRSAVTSGFGISQDNFAKNFPTALFKQVIAEVKQLRPLYSGDFYPLTEISVKEDVWCAWQFDRPDLKRGFAVFFRRPKAAQVFIEAALHGIDPQASYEVTFADTGKTVKLTGAQMANFKAEISAAPGSLLITYRKLAQERSSGSFIETRQAREETMLNVKDACIYSDDSGQRWTLGTRAVEQVFECKDGRFRLASCKNKLVSPPLEYAEAHTSGSMFEPDTGTLLARFEFEKVWSAVFAKRETIHAVDKTVMDVKEGDLIGFRADKADKTPSSFGWNIALEYEDGAPDEVPGGSCLSDGAMYTLSGGDLKAVADKIPGVVHFSLGSQANRTRVWKAPRDGRIRIGGSLVSASHDDLDAGIYRIREKKEETAIPSGLIWTIESGHAREVAAGGRPAAQLDLKLKSQSLRLHLHFLVYPDTSVIRQWMEIENSGAEPFVLKSPASLLVNLAGGGAPWLHYWMTGANSGPTQGQLKKARVGDAYRNSLTGERTEQFVPWTALQHESPARDGLFVSSESLSAWNISVLRGSGPAVKLAVCMLGWAGTTLQPGERIEFQPLTTGVFAGGLDDMGARVYDWQYQYLWDYTNSEYYARTQYLVPWFFCGRNLQEQFAGRLAGLDMEGADHARAAGFDLLWDDAGWAKHPAWPVPDKYGAVFHHEYEGPDFSQTQRYLRKMRAKWVVWFCGRPSSGVMDAKIAAWGDFQWRTDAVGLFQPASEKLFREKVELFLNRHPNSSFHTCDGGSRYAHTFEIQRCADLNYLSDFGRGDETNYYFSYLDTPDKWSDLLEVMPEWRYKPETSRQMLTMAPCWYTTEAADKDCFRRDNEIYHYLLKEGVAGRWSYVFHPEVTGDREYYYFQRTNHDRTKACIILKHRAGGEVKICPRGLLPGHQYIVGLDSTPQTTLRSGADLMANGIVIKDQKPGELIYLGLPNRPGAPADKIVPPAPGRVFKRFETNLGHSGTGIYWVPGTGETWISYYEVRRAGQVLGKASIGNSFFDHSDGWDCAADYSVRAIGGNGLASDWKNAEPIEGEALSFSALGGHFSTRGRDGWSAETTLDGKVFQPMTWVAPVKNPAADTDGGTPNQTGGVEGYWEGAETARVGRAWQQVSKTAACARSWTAPRGGTVRVIGRVMKEYFRQSLGNEALHAAILLGSKQVWPEKGLAGIRPGDLEGATHDFTLTVKAGEVLRFVLEKGEDTDNGIAAWMPKIVYAGETAAKQDCPAVRILCGSPADYTDTCGNLWAKDAYYSGGESIFTQEKIEAALPAREDMRLYQCGREGEEFAYAIPVKPGLYSIRLKFAETQTQWMHERPVNVSINGQQVLNNFDVCHAVRGSRKACERTFRNIIPGKDGFIRMRFTAGADPLQTLKKARIQAIEVLPELRPAIRINCGAESQFTDWNSSLWSADACFEGGQTLRAGASAAVAHASPTIYDQQLYRTARTGRSFAYKIAVPAGLYTVRLKFAELWLKETGQRPMNVEVNGLRIRENWDPAQAAGELGMTADLRLEDVAPDAAGRIVIRIAATGGNDAVLQGIEIE